MEPRRCFCGMREPHTLQEQGCRYVIGIAIAYVGARTLQCIQQMSFSVSYGLRRYGMPARLISRTAGNPLI
jgi:hypothetical protein